MGEEDGGDTVIHKYRILGKAGEGTFSEVLKAVHIHTKKYVAIKRMKQKFHSVQQVNSLREVQALRRLNPHNHIIGLKEIIFDRRVGSLSLVCELCDQNLYEVIRGRTRPLDEKRISHLVTQLLNALDHTHRAGIYHRDIKPENVLVSHDRLKLADFGSCRALHSKHPLTEYISTRWYRPPECLLTEGRYGFKMDLWAAGCVMYELTTLRPLFPGSNELDQIHRIHNTLGSPSDKILNKFYKHRNRQIPWDFPQCNGTGIERGIGSLLSRSGIQLLYKLVKYDPDERITAKQALRSEWCNVAKSKPIERKRNARESSRDSGVDLDSPSVASNYVEMKKEKEKIVKKPELKTYPIKKMATAAEQLADVKGNKGTGLQKFKYNTVQGFDLRRAIQQKNQIPGQKLPSINHKPKASKLSQLSSFGGKNSPTRLPQLATTKKPNNESKVARQKQQRLLPGPGAGLDVKKYPSPKMPRKNSKQLTSTALMSPGNTDSAQSKGSNGKRKRKRSITRKKKKLD